MKEILLITGVFDRLSGGDSGEKSGRKSNETEDYTLEDYQEILDEYKDAEAEILINIATIYFEQENIKESMKTLKRAIDIYKELQDIGKQAIVYDLMGDINRYNNKTDLALDNYRESYHLYSEIKSDNKDEMKEKIKELEVVHNAVQVGNSGTNTITNYGTPSNIPPEISDEEEITADYNKISANIEEVIGMLKGADTYISYAKSEDPMEELENAYEMSSGIGDDTAKATLLLIIGYVSLDKSETNNALKYFNESLENFQEIEDKQGEAVSRLLIGTADYINGDMEKVSDNFRKSIEIIRGLEDVVGENIAMRLMNAIYEG